MHWDTQDADEVAPSVYTTGRAARRKQLDDSPPAPGPDAPAAPPAAKPAVNGGPAKAVGMPDSEPYAPG
jgi:hypothetical protein